MFKRRSSFLVVISNLKMTIKMIRASPKEYFRMVVKFKIFDHLGPLLPPLAHFLRLSARSSAKENGLTFSIFQVRFPQTVLAGNILRKPSSF